MLEGNIMKFDISCEDCFAEFRLLKLTSFRQYWFRILRRLADSIVYDHCPCHGQPGEYSAKNATVRWYELFMAYSAVCSTCRYGCQTQWKTVFTAPN